MDRATGESILKAVPRATLDLVLEAHKMNENQRLAQEPQHCARSQAVACSPFRYRGASLSLMGGWDPHKYPRSPALIWLLGELPFQGDRSSVGTKHSQFSNSEGGGETLLSPASWVDDTGRWQARKLPSLPGQPVIPLLGRLRLEN